MALNFLLKRSGTADKRPNPNSMASGEIDLNYDAVTGGVFYKDSAGDVVKVGSAQVSATAPNAVPVGSAGNSDGEFWYDTSTTTLKIWNGSAWVATGVGLATDAETQAGTNSTDAVTPSGLQSKVSDSVSTSSSTTLASSSAVKSVFDTFEAFQYSQVLNVSKLGNDTTGNGGQHKPYATLTKALTMITDASPTKRYVIQVSAGAYTETTVSLKANVFIVGDQKEAVRITATTFNLASNFTGNDDNRSGMSNVILLGICNFDWNAVTSEAGKLYFNQCSFAGGSVTLNGYNNATAQGSWESCQFFNALTISGINVFRFSDNTCLGNVTLNQHPNGGMVTSLVAVGGQMNGTLTLNATVNDFNRRCSLFAKNFYCENITINGAAAYADVNVGSMPRQRDRVIITNGGNFVPITATSPIVTNTVQSGEPGFQNYSYLGYVHGSTNSDLYLLTMAGAYAPASTGFSIQIEADSYGLTTNTNGGNINLTTATVSGTGVRGEIKLNGREVDVSSTKIVNLTNGTDTNDAVNYGQLINLPLTPLTLTDTVSTPLLSVSASTFRAVIVNISASNDTTGRYHTDTVHVNHNGTGTDLKLIEGAAIGLGPYTVSAALTAGNLVVSVASNSASATKYVGNYQTFAI